jgi:sirohydrochlorin cobaltochelatase
MIVVAHGSRDPGWARPFEALHERLALSFGAECVRLAFLQLQPPSLTEALDEAAAQGHLDLAVLPLLLGEGDHLRRDVPAAIAEAIDKAPGLRVELLPALLDDAGVMAAVEALAKAAILPPSPLL